MNANLHTIPSFIKQNIPNFHANRLKSLSGLQLKKILKRKNPYLFRAKNFLLATDLVRGFLDAHLSSQEEGIFGSFLEQLAVEASRLAHGGRKSIAEGVDLQFERDGILFIVSIKSGPNWGNSGQIKKMQDNFLKARRILATNSTQRNLVAIEGCCYGSPMRKDYGDRLKLCGQGFWEFLTGDPNFYIEIVDPIGHEANRHDEAFRVEYAATINRLVTAFGADFCFPTGAINWTKLIEFNSGPPASE